MIQVFKMSSTSTYEEPNPLNKIPEQSFFTNLILHLMFMISTAMS